jgi:UDP-N-acetyl-D-galactosamine dehydrogenase
MDKIAVIGAGGYVGLPLTQALVKAGYSVVGYDTNEERIAELNKLWVDPMLVLTSDFTKMDGCNVFIICVPTPVDKNKQPDLALLETAGWHVGASMVEDSLVINESTVYPGATEDVVLFAIVKGQIDCKRTDDGLIPFAYGYSSERINPGDDKHTLETIVKVVSGCDAPTLDRVAKLYESIGCTVHRAPSIKVAEASKVLENTQRDVNIALMNEAAMIFDKLGIDTHDVLDAARTKWNWCDFQPGLVGGHCISVDPYYLASKAREVGVQPNVILAARERNDGMAKVIAEKAVKIAGTKKTMQIFGATFKPNVADFRNSLTPVIASELKEYRVSTHIIDPMINNDRAYSEATGKERLFDIDTKKLFHVAILAVPHNEFMQDYYYDIWNEYKIILDVCGALDPSKLASGTSYWRL